MTTRIVYVNPGDIVEVRVCHPEETRDKSGWSSAARPMKFGFCVRPGGFGISVFDDTLDIFGGRQQGRIPRQE